MSRKKDTCVMDGCVNDRYYKQSGLCTACYAFLYYWQDRSVTDKMRHVRKIERWNQRVHAGLMPAKVSSISNKRKAG